MKKISNLLLAFILLLGIVACTNESTQDEPNQNELTEENNNQEEQEKKQEKETETSQEGFTEEKNEEDHTSVIKDQAHNIMESILNKDMDMLATYVHPTKGLLFSPYVYVNEDAVSFEKGEVAKLFDDEKEYQWGVYDGSGKPIKLTPEEYFEEFVYNPNYNQPNEILLDQQKQRGNMKNNINHFFQEAHVVEFHFEGTEENKEMDWESLNLVFQQHKQGSWKLVAIVHDQWTI